MKVAAILWDYDGTLVDSTGKNMAVTIDVLKNFDPDIEDNLPEALTSVESYKKANYQYKNWRELYKNAYQLTESQVEEAGKLWSPCQLSNRMTADLYPNLDSVIRTFRHIPQGICSQNCSINIKKTLHAYHVLTYFNAIIGYEEVPYLEQKPNPAGFIKCMEMLPKPEKNTTIIYIGDHEEDVSFGKNAEIVLKQKGYDISVTSIAVDYSGSTPGKWRNKPDFIASDAKDIQNVITAL